MWNKLLFYEYLICVDSIKFVCTKHNPLQPSDGYVIAHIWMHIGFDYRLSTTTEGSEGRKDS